MKFLRRRKTEVRVIPIDILLDIELHHKDDGSDTREIAGRIVVQNGVAVRYERIENLSTRPFHVEIELSVSHFDYDLPKTEFGIFVHSHPGERALSEPSKEDLTLANDCWLMRPYGIYMPATGQLKLWLLHKDRKGYDRVPFKIGLGPNGYSRKRLHFPRYEPMPTLDLTDILH